MWPNLQESANLVTFTNEIFNKKLHFYAVWSFNLTLIYNIILATNPAAIYTLKVNNGNINTHLTNFSSDSIILTLN